MHQVALTGLRPLRKLVVFGLLVVGGISSVNAQPFFGEEPPPDLTEPTPQPTPPLFVPIKPGQPDPTPELAPIPAATPAMFVPSDIPPPAIQASGETVDIIPEAVPPVAIATPVPVPSTRLTQPVSTTPPSLPVQQAAPTSLQTQLTLSPARHRFLLANGRPPRRHPPP